VGRRGRESVKYRIMWRVIIVWCVSAATICLICLKKETCSGAGVGKRGKEEESRKRRVGTREDSHR
jgi:hypothetical protein